MKKHAALLFTLFIVPLIPAPAQIQTIASAQTKLNTKRDIPTRPRRRDGSKPC